jgi:hypothetical protein
MAKRAESRRSLARHRRAMQQQPRPEHPEVIQSVVRAISLLNCLAASSNGSSADRRRVADLTVRSYGTPRPHDAAAGAIGCFDAWEAVIARAFAVASRVFKIRFAVSLGPVNPPLTWNTMERTRNPRT